MGNFIKQLTRKFFLHKFAAAFTAVCIVFMCVPFAKLQVSAAEGEYALTFDDGEGKFYSVNSQAERQGEYTALDDHYSWNGDTKTLTLNNFVYSTTAQTGLIFEETQTNTINIVLEGSNSISSTPSSGSANGIWMGYNKTLTFSGSGSLSITAVEIDGGVSSMGIYGVYANIELTESFTGSIDINVDSADYYSNGIIGNLTLIGGTLTITAEGISDEYQGETLYPYGVDGNVLTINGGTLEITTSSDGSEKALGSTLTSITPNVPYTYWAGAAPDNLTVNGVKKAAYEESTGAKTYAYLKIDCAPALSAGTISRTSDTAATIGFTTNETVTAYYAVVEDNAGCPSTASLIASAWHSLGSVSGTVTNKSVTLTEGVKDIWVAVTDSGGNISTLKIDAAAYATPSSDDTNSDGYSDADVAAITTLGLSGFSTTPSEWTTDNASVDGTATVVWDESSPKRITALDIHSGTISGTFSLTASGTGLSELERLNVSVNSSLTSVTVSGFSKLNYLYLNNCDLSTATLSDLTAVRALDIGNNTDLTTLDLSDLTNLQALQIDYTGLTAIDLSDNIELLSLYADDSSSLATINLTGLTKLGAIQARNCNLSSLDVTDCIDLGKAVSGIGNGYGGNSFDGNGILDVSGNHLTSLDLTGLTYLTSSNTTLTGQTSSLTLVGDDENGYDLEIDLNNPTTLATVLSYAADTLTSTSAKPATSPFSVRTDSDGTNGISLSGTLSLTYTAPTAVTFSTLTANGTSGTADTDTLTLTFSQDITGLAASDLQVSGATPGDTLTRTGTGTYTIGISNIVGTDGDSTFEQDDTVSVLVSKAGYSITNDTKTVTVNKDTRTALEGSVSIDLNASNGTLFANIAGLTNKSGAITYAWSGEGLTSSNSSLDGMGHLGKEITLTVTDSNHSGNKQVTIRVFRVTIAESGDTGADNASIVNQYGRVGSSISISYILDNTGSGSNNLTYSGAAANPATVSAPGTGTSAYTIVAADDTNADGIIELTATFAHTDTAPSDTPVTASALTITAPVAGATPLLTATEENAGINSAAVSWSDSPTTFAANTEYTATVTLTAASGYIFDNAPSAPTGLTTYASGATFVSNNGTTLVFTVPFTTGKYTGSTIAAVPTYLSKSDTAISVNAATLTTATGQTIQYAISESGASAPATGWDTATSFTGLSASTTYYVWAKAQASTDYDEGTASASAAITTNAAAPSTYAVTLTVNKDGTEFEAHGKTFTLRQNEAVVETGEGTGTVTFTTVASGIYVLFDGDTDTKITIIVNDNETATINYYTVSFNSNEGSSVSSQVILNGETATSPSAPTRSGYTFSGWSTSSSEDLPFEFTTAITGTTTLYAQWDEVVKTVSVGTQSGTITAGTAGSAAFTVTTANIGNAEYNVTVANLPTGVTVGNSGKVTITGNSGILTLTGDTNTIAGSIATLTLTIDGTTSAAFTLTIAADTTPTVSSVSVSPATPSVQKGTTQQFTATVNGTNSPDQTVTWDVTGVSPVDSGTTIVGGLLTVSANETNTTLTVSAQSTADTSYTGTATVTVTEEPPIVIPVAVNGVTISGANRVTVGGVIYLTATVSPMNADNKSVMWDSSNPGVATVSGGTVYAISAGTTTITVTTVDGNFTDTLTITVTNPAPPPYNPPSTPSTPSYTPSYTPPAPAPTPAPPAPEPNPYVLPSMDVNETPEGTEVTTASGVTSTVKETPEGVKVEAGVNESGSINSQATAAAVSEAAQIAKENGETSVTIQIPEGATGLSKSTVQKLVEAADGLEITLELTAIVDGEVVGGVTLPLNGETGQILTGLHFGTKRTEQIENYVGEKWDTDVLGSFETAQKGGWGATATLSIGLDKLGFSANDGTKLYALIYDTKANKWYQAAAEIIDGEVVIKTKRTGIVTIVTDSVK